MDKNNITRLIGLDLLRAFLIIIGVFYHASLVVYPMSWVYKSPHYNSYVIGLLFEFFHMFRMETFFLLSGFFSTLLIEKKGKKYYIENRKNRILIPSLFLFFIIGIPQYYFLIYDGTFNYDAMISHFWFLQTLIAFIAIQCLYLIKMNYKKQIMLSVFLYFLASPTDYIFSKILILNLFHGSISDIFKYLIYYIIGTYLYFNYNEIINKVQNHFTKISTIAVITSMISIILTAIIWKRNGFLFEPEATTDLILFVEKFISYYISIPLLHLLNSFCISFILLYMFSKINFTNNYITFIIQSSLCIYILHHPILIILGIFLDNYNLNLFSYFFILSTISLLIPCLIFYIFRGNLIFNKIFGVDPVNLKTRNKMLKSD